MTISSAQNPGPKVHQNKSTDLTDMKGFFIMKKPCANIPTLGRLVWDPVLTLVNASASSSDASSVFRPTALICFSTVSNLMAERNPKALGVYIEMAW